MNHDALKDIVSNLLTHLGLPFEKLELKDEDDYTRVDITSNQASRIIGWHGETLNSLQHLAKSLLRSQEKLSRSPFIVLDVDGYRQMQEDKVRAIAQQKAEFVRKTGSRVALAPMSPYFRRVVHLFIANDPDMQDLMTESTGEGDYRQIVLRQKNQKAESDQELSPVIAEDDGLDNLDV